ncbi:MAG: carbamoyltransferase HypF [Anaerovoracaceae bacterium]
MIPADLSICPHCLAEMKDPKNPRYAHPFISCMVCGPRYTIIDKFPYDRENTSMVDFPLCGDCEEEYTNIADRRYHAQTISCHHCGPQMEYKLNGDHLSDKPPLEKAAALLKEGRVIAFKSMGGYNLMANPFDAQAVSCLRAIKNREQKPFALMFSGIEEISSYCNFGEVEKTLIASSAKPILLLERKPIEELEAFCPRNYDELKKSRFIGAFLPSMGAQYILLEAFGGPLIVTSANLSGMPIIKEEEEIFALMEATPDIAETFYNSRKIRVSVDDSVVRVIDNQPQMIRRSKGYAPVPLYVEGAEGQILATGGQLKNSFCLSKGRFAYPSQYFGDMDTVEMQRLYEENVKRMTELFKVQPEKVVCDLHPLYYTTSFARQYAEERNLPLIQVQHHHAHVASVMAEHDLQGKVIGVAFDGTGYGTDGAIWGGEFLLCAGSTFVRKAHLKYVDLIGGDSSMKDGYKSAISYMYALDQGYLEEDAEDEIQMDLREIVDYARKNETLAHRQEGLILAALKGKINVIKSASMGRLFDGVSALLGICDYNKYEGQCAILLEDAAARGKNFPGSNEADDLALKFHRMVAEKILETCMEIREAEDCNQVALTGGVFQNKILMEESLALLRGAGFMPYYNVSVSPNDGGISLGQMYVAAKGEK